MIKKVSIMSLALICVSLSGYASGNPGIHQQMQEPGAELSKYLNSPEHMVHSLVLGGMRPEDARLKAAEYDLKQQQAELLRLQSEAIVSLKHVIKVDEAQR